MLITFSQALPNPREDLYHNQPRQKLKLSMQNDDSFSLCIKDPIMINLDDDINSNNVDTNDFDDIYEIIEINRDLSLRFSKSLIIAPSEKQNESSLKHGLYLELIVASSTVPFVAPLASCTPSLKYVEKD